jgi:hypothetical protein
MTDGLEGSRRRALLFIKSDFELGSFAQSLVVAAVPIGILVQGQVDRRSARA